ncbi:MAG: YceI family protein [Nannocystaceae bacterium]|nr:YceI family protein [Myxococcales bacterium]
MQDSAPTLRVFTFKDGLLARLAHDLQLTLGRFRIARDGDAVTGTFWPETLMVDGAVKRGAIDHGALSESDRAKILESMRADVLHTRAHPEISFQGQLAVDGATCKVRGALTLVGQTKPVEARLALAGGRIRGEIELVPSRWGIRPFKALAGAIKMQDRVLVTIDAPWEPGPAGVVERGG